MANTVPRHEVSWGSDGKCVPSMSDGGPEAGSRNLQQLLGILGRNHIDHRVCYAALMKGSTPCDALLTDAVARLLASPQPAGGEQSRDPCQVAGRGPVAGRRVLDRKRPPRAQPPAAVAFVHAAEEHAAEEKLRAWRFTDTKLIGQGQSAFVFRAQTCDGSRSNVAVKLFKQLDARQAFYEFHLWHLTVGPHPGIVR